MLEISNFWALQCKRSYHTVHVRKVMCPNDHLWQANLHMHKFYSYRIGADEKYKGINSRRSDEELDKMSNIEEQILNKTYSK